MKRLLKDLQEEVSDPTTIYCDNLSSIQLAKNPVFHARTKHIEVHYHFVRERVLSGEVELQYVPTDRQTADIFTKPLGLDKLRQFSGALGLRHLDVPNLRGRKVSKDQAAEQERSGRDRDTESDDELDWASVTAPEVFIYKFRRGCCRVISEGLGLNPFRAVVRGHDDVPIPCSGRGGLEWAHKI